MRPRPLLTALLASAALLVCAATAAANPPGNDHRKNAWTLTPGVAISGSTTFATKEAQNDGNRPGTGNRSVWFRWTAPQTGRITITVTAAAFDSVVAAYPGWYDPSSVPTVADADAGAGDTTSSITFDAKAGQLWEIAVDGTSPAQHGAYAIAASFTTSPPPPANDAFANAQTAVPGGWMDAVSFSHRYATKEAGEPQHRTQGTSKSVWFRWTPAQSGRALARASCGKADLGSTNAVVAVYTGVSLPTLQEVPYETADPAGCSFSRVTFKVVAGTTYRIAVDNASADTGNSALTLEFDNTPPKTTFLSTGSLYGASSMLSWKADEDATYACRLDGQPRSCTTFLSMQNVASGPHTLEVRATDRLGNVETAWRSKTFTVDKTPPDTTITAGPAALVKTALGQTVTFTSSEPGTTFRCTIHVEIKPEPCTSPYTFSQHPWDGTVAFRVFAVDAAGNADPTPAIWKFDVWSKKPDPKPAAAPPAPKPAAAPAPATVPAPAVAPVRARTVPSARPVYGPTVLRLRAPGGRITRSALRRSGLPVVVRCPGPCALAVELRMGTRVAGRVRAVSGRWATLRLNRAGRALLRKAPAAGAKVTVTALDGRRVTAGLRIVR